MFIAPFQRCDGKIAEQSGMAINYVIVVQNGMIDSDYCGEFVMVLFQSYQ